MVPVLPFSVLFIAIVEAQAPECYTFSEHFLALAGCLPPVPIEEIASIKEFYPPDMELNGDVWGWRPKEISKPRIPPYIVGKWLLMPQRCAPKPNAWGVMEIPERPPSGRCEQEWDGFPLKSDAATK